MGDTDVNFLGLAMHRVQCLSSRVRHVPVFTCSRVAGTFHARRLHAANSSGRRRLKLTYPEAPTSQHSDLASFEAYARRTGLDNSSSVYVGTHYEYSTAQSLARYGFFLKRIGGASDKGTDLIGTWSLPGLGAAPMRLLAQCKAGARRVGPQHVRELEGSFGAAPVGWRGDGVLGVLVGEAAATRGVRDALARSTCPMVYACCSRDGVVSQMLWNRRAEELGLEGYGVSVKHGGREGQGQLVLVRHGKAVPLLTKPKP